MENWDCKYITYLAKFIIQSENLMIAIILRLHSFSSHLKHGEEKTENFCILFSWQSRIIVTDIISLSQTWLLQIMSLSEASQINHFINMKDFREIIISRVHSSLCTRVIEHSKLWSIPHFLLIGAPVNSLSKTIPFLQLHL